MKAIVKTVARNNRSAPLALVAFLASMAPGADAKHRAASPSEQPATLVAHVPLAGSPANQINLQENGGLAIPVYRSELESGRHRC